MFSRFAFCARIPSLTVFALGVAFAGCGNDAMPVGSGDMAVPSDLEARVDAHVLDLAAIDLAGRDLAGADLAAHDLATADDGATGGSDGGACAGLPDGAACNDGNACTQTDTCESGVCVGGNPVTCTASDQCHAAGSCDSSTGHCSDPAATDGTLCDDGNACTQTDTCESGVCVGGNPVTCTASDQCHAAGSCDSSTGHCSDPAATDGTLCDDGNACTQTDTCESGSCIGANPVSCSAAGECYDVGTCDSLTGVCSTPYKGLGTSCSTGQCDGAGNCVAQPSVVSTVPADGSSITAPTDIVITFSTAMDPTSLFTQGTSIDVGCDGEIQVSYDNFTTCLTYATNAVTMSPDNKTVTVTPVPGVLVNLPFKIKVLKTVKSAVGLNMAADFVQATGFTAGSPSGAVVVENETGSASEAQYCDVQFPISMDGTTGLASGAVYGQIYEAGMTDVGSLGTIRAQLGYGPLTANPEYDASWTFLDAVQNTTCTGCGNNAEYMASFTLPAPGTYGYVYRMSIDSGATWTYCDLAGAGRNPGLATFDFGHIPILTVTP